MTEYLSCEELYLNFFSTAVSVLLGSVRVVFLTRAFVRQNSIRAFGIRAKKSIGIGRVFVRTVGIVVGLLYIHLRIRCLKNLVGSKK